MRKLLISLLFVLASGTCVSAPLPREIVVNGVEFVHVPAGWFWYGFENGAWNTAGTPGHPPHYRDIRVWLDGFYIGKFEARARDFQRFMSQPDVAHRTQYKEGETEGCSVRRKPDGRYVLVDPDTDLPATHLSWELAREFSQWMGFRLPSEGEWTKAARGSTDKRLWPWGDEYPDDTRAAYAANWDCKPSPVTAFELGKSPYGAYNMAGNVFEFVEDWYNEGWDDALKDGVRNPALAKSGSRTEPYPGPMKMLKGGRWSSPANGLSPYRRQLHDKDGVFICYGVRFALDEAKAADLLARGQATVVAP